MSNKNNACPICHGGNKKPDNITFTVEFGTGVIVIRGVPALVCDLCGTEWIEDTIAEKLEYIVKQTKNRYPVVEVTNWKNEIKELAS